MTARNSGTRSIGAGMTAPLFEKDTLALAQQESQPVLVLTGGCGISPALAQMAEALEIRLVAVGSHHDLPFRLHLSRPMAIISETDPQAEASCAALRCIAAFDQEMPVLLVSGNDPGAQGTIDAAEKLWGLTGLHQLPNVPGPSDLIAFLFQAGRQSGTGRLIPLT